MGICPKIKPTNNSVIICIKKKGIITSNFNVDPVSRTINKKVLKFE